MERSSKNQLKVYIRSALTEQFLSFNREHGQLMQSSYPEEWRLEQRHIGGKEKEREEKEGKEKGMNREKGKGINRENR